MSRGSLSLRIPRELLSPNKWNGRHWRVKHRISQEWEAEIQWAVVAMQAQLFGARAAEASLGLVRWAKDREISMPVPDRWKVSVTREVPSLRNFIRDDDNLRFSVKPLMDALKRQGYIFDDSRKWIDLPTPEQKVSADGGYWTQIDIEAID